jgi:5-methylcytosine-specific restriction enzyme subunit McrC
VITVYEYSKLEVGESYSSNEKKSEVFTPEHFNALEAFAEDESNFIQSETGNFYFPYYNVGNKKIKFDKYVGVIQVGDLSIEVLPKLDKQEKTETTWRNILIGMLQAVHKLEAKATSFSDLEILPDSFLDLLFLFFIQEVEGLLHGGLAKQYRKDEGNLGALKGRLIFSKHIQQNIVHQERFYTSHTVYDVEHTLHKILYETLKVVKRLNTNPDLKGRVGALLLNFPEMPSIKPTQALFDRIVYSRKTESYRRAIHIAKMILLNYHPDLKGGENDVLAIMFNMAQLWEEFVAVSLEGAQTQVSKNFWKNRHLRPDIVVSHEDKNYVLDTKWKSIQGASDVAVDDLYQMFAYSESFEAQKVALLYPGEGTDERTDTDFKMGKGKRATCDLLFIQVNEKITEWQTQIREKMDTWMRK